MNKSVNVIYISYDGILEPLGQSQVLAYLVELSKYRKIYLISFEKENYLANKFELNRLKKIIINENIEWHYLIYHKKFSVIATSWDILCGVFLCIKILKKNKIKIIHARSYVSSLIALIVKKFMKIYFIFDMRGFWADERVEGEIWKRDSLIYQIAKYFEKQFIINSDHIISLTQKGKDEVIKFQYYIKPHNHISIIPTCVDLNKFNLRKINNERSSHVIGYVGSAGTWYLFEEVAKCFVLILKHYPDTKFLIINRNEHVYINEKLKKAGLSNLSYKIVNAEYYEIPNYMAKIDAAVFFIKPVYSKRASSPTRFAEFLACGIPCLINEGVGDMDKYVIDEKIGVSINSFEDISMEIAIKKIFRLINDNNTKEECRKIALTNFSLNIGVSSYNEIYNKFN
jgi:hypothetical protein